MPCPYLDPKPNLYPLKCLTSAESPVGGRFASQSLKRYWTFISFFPKTYSYPDSNVGLTYPYSQVPTTTPLSQIFLCTISCKALLLVNLQTLQCTNLPSTPLTSNPTPIPTHLTKLPNRLHSILIHPRPPRLIISQRRCSQQALYLFLRRHPWYPRHQ